MVLRRRIIKRRRGRVYWDRFVVLSKSWFVLVQRKLSW